MRFKAGRSCGSNEIRLEQGRSRTVPQGKDTGPYFEKPSTRTIVIQTAMYRLGGQCIYLSSKDTQNWEEPLEARLAYCPVVGIMIAFSQTDLGPCPLRLIPVINGLTDRYICRSSG